MQCYGGTRVDYVQSEYFNPCIISMASNYLFVVICCLGGGIPSGTQGPHLVVWSGSTLGSAQGNIVGTEDLNHCTAMATCQVNVLISELPLQPYI